MKKRFQKMLAPNSVMFYVLFFLFAVVGLYFSRVYGAAGIVVCIILRIVSLRTNAARRRQVQELMNNIEVDGGEIRPAVTRSPLPTAVALATTGEIVWANDAFAEISGRGTAVSGVRMGEIAPTFETGWLIKGQTGSYNALVVLNLAYLLQNVELARDQLVQLGVFDHEDILVAVVLAQYGA